MANAARSTDKQPSKKEGDVTSYSVKVSEDHVDVTVTAGRLVGKSARLIPMPPAAAYFNVDGKKKRA